uniref:bifunctional adenosylcobinamide kinase/adenosylcobinamide-phosphate guanylyltransferase n=1 Tax=Halomonas sp. TaxID=1486246 RepID=UPI002605F079|nr:bifunctional adenosylcobinamide kinase/adenosylcobinamide-phosphate guanylyltransferase [Halomonas sp.]
MIVFVSGGVRSGKSRVAESLARSLHQQPDRCGGRLWYLATAKTTDGEMRERIARHRCDRGDGWTTLEAPWDLASAWRQVGNGDTLLLDCLTLWASQVMFDSPLDDDQALAMFGELLDDARARSIALVVVSNDLNEALPPRDAMVWRYLAFLQRIHCHLADVADRVVEVVAGQVIDWKAAPCALEDETRLHVEERIVTGERIDTKRHT